MGTDLNILYDWFCEQGSALRDAPRPAASGAGA